MRVDEQIDDNDPFFADADDHNEGEENDNNKRNSGDAQDDIDSKKREGVIEGSNKSLFYDSGSDSDGGKDNETEGRNKDKEAKMIQERNVNEAVNRWYLR